MRSLLQQFIDEECNSAVLRLLEGELQRPSVRKRRFEFNRFEVTISREEDLILLEDVLDATDTGDERLSVAEFVAALGRVPR